MLQQSRSIFFYLALLFTPFVIMVGIPEGYEVPKFLFLTFGGGIFGMLMVFSKEKTMSMPKIPILSFYISLVVASIFSIEINYSLIGNFPRHSLSLFFMVAVFLIQLTYLNYFPKFNFHVIFLIVSNLLSVFTFFETSERPISTIGQPNFLGILIVFGIVSGIKMLLDGAVLNKTNVLIFLSLILQIFVLFKTASITSFVAFLIGCFYLLHIHKKYIFLTLLVFLIGWLFLLNPLLTKKATDIFQQLRSNDNLEVSDALNIRVALWESSINMWMQNPKTFLIGSGPETFRLLHEKFRSPKLNYTSEWSYFFDKPHNLFLQILVEGGLLSLVAFLWLIYSFMTDKSNEYKLYLFLSLIFFFWNWNFIYHSLVFFLMASNPKNSIKIKFSIPIKISIFLTSVTLIIFVIFYIKNIANLSKQNQIYLSEESQYYFDTNNPEHELQGLQYFSRNPVQQKEFIAHLKSKYPSHLVFLTEVYLIEKFHYPEDSINTKERIKKLRPDLVEWHEMFR